jgi:hypothetical protein
MQTPDPLLWADCLVQVKDEGMAHLAQITSLHELHFEREAMTDDGIMQLTALTSLQMLALRECRQVGGGGLYVFSGRGFFGFFRRELRVQRQVCVY